MSLHIQQAMTSHQQNLNLLQIFGRTAARHTHQQQLAFLKHLNREAPDGVTLHLIFDNYATHKHAKVKSWIAWHNQRHRKAHGIDRVVQHFTPTSSSWMNLVERFFRDLTQDVVRNGSFASVPELVDAINDYFEEHNLEPKRYVWRQSSQVILAKIQGLTRISPKVSADVSISSLRSIFRSRSDTTRSVSSPFVFKQVARLQKALEVGQVVTQNLSRRPPGGGLRQHPYCQGRRNSREPVGETLGATERNNARYSTMRVTDKGAAE